MSSTGPLVSVFMPTYNGEAFLAETIESVLGQTYETIELVAVDDASTDNTPEILAGYARSYPDRVRFERKNSRAGPCRRRNDAIALARGELLAWLDQDDLWLPTKTEQQVAVLARDERVGLVYSGYESFDSETGKPLAWRDAALEREGDGLVPLFVEGCFIASLTALFRRKVLTRRGLRLRENNFSFGDDYYLWLTLALDWQVVRIDEVLARYRRHSENESARLAETNFHLSRIELLHEFLAEFPEARSRLGGARRRGFANHYVKAADFERVRGRRSRARRLWLQAFLSDPVLTSWGARP